MVCCLLFSCSELMSGNALATCLCSNLIPMHVIYCVLLSTVYSTTCGWDGVARALREPCHSPCVPLLKESYLLCGICCYSDCIICVLLVFSLPCLNCTLLPSHRDHLCVCACMHVCVQDGYSDAVLRPYLLYNSCHAGL